jgi:hypothetical protein
MTSNSSSNSPCGVGGTFQKSGGGFLVTGLDMTQNTDQRQSASQMSLRVGDLAIAIDDIPLADMSSAQFRYTCVLRVVSGEWRGQSGSVKALTRLSLFLSLLFLFLFLTLALSLRLSPSLSHAHASDIGSK